MTLPASLALLSAGISCFVAAMGAQFARAPGWRDQRYLLFAVLAIAGYTTVNLPTNLAVPDEVVVICTRLQIAAAAFHAWAWLRHTSLVSGRASPRTDRTLGFALAFLAAVGITTPLFVRSTIYEHASVPLDATYRSPLFTLAGSLALAAILGVLAIPMTRLLHAWRRRVRGSAGQFFALAAVLSLGVHDALVVTRVYDGPYLIEFGFLLPLVAVAYSFTSRFVEDARALAALRSELERQVLDRTNELGKAQAALHRAEKLAALGQFAAGVAHEVNNPSAVVSASLQYLSEAEAAALSSSGREAIEEALRSVRRISVIVRQLLDAGRLAGSSEPTQGVELAALGESALQVAWARLGKRVTLVNEFPAGVCVAGQESVLVQVVVNLVVNAIQAIPEQRADGRVVLRSESDGDRVRVVVEDNGVGMPPDVLHRVFEPFFTTKPFGSGTGLGLAVSRALITGLGGDLRLESRPGEGTRAVVELPRAEAPTRTPAPGAGLPVVGGKRRLMLVDDEPAVLTSVRRLLEQYFRVEIASGVDDCLLRLESGDSFDVVLCDVMMPAGGGERLYQTLLGHRPSLARRVVFLTGGAITEGARRFLRDQPQPVLAKPLDLRELAQAAEAVAKAEPPARLH